MSKGSCGVKMVYSVFMQFCVSVPYVYEGGSGSLFVFMCSRLGRYVRRGAVVRFILLIEGNYQVVYQ